MEIVRKKSTKSALLDFVEIEKSSYANYEICVYIPEQTIVETENGVFKLGMTPYYNIANWSNIISGLFGSSFDSRCVGRRGLDLFDFTVVTAPVNTNEPKHVAGLQKLADVISQIATETKHNLIVIKLRPVYTIELGV